MLKINSILSDTLRPARIQEDQKPLGVRFSDVFIGHLYCFWEIQEWQLKKWLLQDSWGTIDFLQKYIEENMSLWQQTW